MWCTKCRAKFEELDMVEINVQSKVKHQKENLGIENLTEHQPSEWLEVLG
jgi:hypothetical protein